MPTLQLSNDVVIHKAESLLRTKFEAFNWEWYDGVATDPDAIGAVDFAITIAMNSRATAGRMRNFMEVATDIASHLRQLPKDVTLGELEDESRVWDRIRKLFAQSCVPNGTKLSVASKVLHRKRPHL